MKKYELDLLEGIQERLAKVVRDLEGRESWYEAEVGAFVTGKKLDNVFIITPQVSGKERDVRAGARRHYGEELVVHITKKSKVVYSINLANLLAIASSNPSPSLGN